MSSRDVNRARVEEALARAEQLRRRRQYEEGIWLLSEALSFGFGRAQIYYRLGNLYYDAGRLEHAEHAYRRAIDHDAHHVNAHHNLGVVYRKQGRIAESLKVRRKASSLARHHPERVRVDTRQVRLLKRFALGWLLMGLGLAVAVALALLLTWRP